jgi:hypothetical protein
LAEILFALDGIAVFTQPDHLLATSAPGWLEGGRVGQFLEVILVGSIVDVQFCFERRSALRAILPPSSMAFIVMIATEGIAAMVAMAAVAGKGEQDILVFIITNPLPATLCFRQRAGFPAQAATRE